MHQSVCIGWQKARDPSCSSIREAIMVTVAVQDQTAILFHALQLGNADTWTRKQHTQRPESTRSLLSARSCTSRTVGPLRRSQTCTQDRPTREFPGDRSRQS